MFFAQIFRFTLFASLWAAANVDIEDVYKISVATVSAWMLASFVACLFMIIGIWKVRNTYYFFIKYKIPSVCHTERVKLRQRNKTC